MKVQKTKSASVIIEISFVYPVEVLQNPITRLVCGHVILNNVFCDISETSSVAS